MNDFMWDDNPINVSTEVNFIWSIANKLRGTYQSGDYKDVIIPMTVIRRLECALENTKDDVVKMHERMPNYPNIAMRKLAKHQFYNTSNFTLAELLNDPDHVADNFRSYIQGFSTNVQDIIASLKFDTEIDTMKENDLLYGVIKAFSEIDLNPRTIDNMKMGYIFEELIRKFSENVEAGDFYTGRDIIKTMVSILLSEGCDDIYDEGKVITIVDQAAGTGGMLSTAHSYISRFNPSADVRLYSQEINSKSYAMCLAEMLIRGQDADNIRKRDTMKMDCFPDQKMRFAIMNPPFGKPWGGKDAGDGVEDAVRAENAKGENGRFPVMKLPGTGDMQLLFFQSAINKLDPKVGRAAIVSNGSPLFSGGTASGESQTRRWMLENDYIEAIIQLSNDAFYNTGIATYIWILSMNKREERMGKVQLIDASSFCHKLRKSLGNKRNEITKEDREVITKLYADFEENEYSKIFNNEDFMYREYAVYQPKQRNYALNKERVKNMVESGALSNFYDEDKYNELKNKKVLTKTDKTKLKKFENNQGLYDNVLVALKDNEIMLTPNPGKFEKELEKILSIIFHDKKEMKKWLPKVMDGLSEMDKTAEIHKDKKGRIIYDTSTKDSEIVPMSIGIDKYMKDEVLPYVPDAVPFFEEDLSKKDPVIKTGAEIPFTRHFYKYEEPRDSEEILKEFKELEAKLQDLLGGV